MSQDLCNVGRNAMNVTKADIHTPYTNVIVTYSEKQENGETVVKQYVATNGTDEGLTLEVNCPWGTQAMADNLLVKINNVRYKPYTVTSALLDPSVELGDAVNTNAVFGGMYTQQSTFGHGFYSDYSAPEDETMNHEYKYESSTERRITRETDETKSYFRATADEINAEVAKKVYKEGGKVQSNSFGWKLLDNSFTLYSNGSAVFTCTKDGLTVNGGGTFSGELSAATGTFAGSLSAATGTFKGSLSAATGTFAGNLSAAGGTFKGELSAATGTFAGSLSAATGTFSGNLSAAGGTFKGELSAATGTFSGTVYCDCLTVRNNAKIGNTLLGDNCVQSAQIQDSAVSDAKISDVGGAKVGSGINGDNLNDGSVPKAKNATGVRTTLTNADNDHTSLTNLFSSTGYVSDIYSTSAHLGKSQSGSVYIYGQKTSWKSVSINGTNIYYLGYNT